MQHSKRLALVLLMFIPLLGFGQAGNSSITGTVKDATDAAIPNVTITLSNLDTGIQLETLTNEVGLFRIGALVPGNYQLQAELPGFNRLTRGPLVLQVSQTLAIDLQLEVGQVNETVEVTEAAPLVVFAVFRHRASRQSPDAGGVAAAESCGFIAGGVGSGRSDDRCRNGNGRELSGVLGRRRARAQPDISFSTAAMRRTRWVLTRPQQLTSLPVDAMQEFKVIANNYSAEFGHSTGGVVTMSTRSGTNQFHGSIFESLRNDALDARNFFAATKPPIRLNQFGGAFGGPIKQGQDAFLSSPGNKRGRRRAIRSLQPCRLWRTARATSRICETAPASRFLSMIRRRQSGRDRQPFLQAIVIPLDRIDPVALKILEYFPLPNRQGTATNASNYVGNSINTLDRNIVVGRAGSSIPPERSGDRSVLHQ